MRGLDPKWRDVPHFIVGVSRESRQDCEIGALRHRHADGLVVRSPASVAVDNLGVIATTMATLVELPDREHLGGEVIGCDDRRVCSRIGETAIGKQFLLQTGQRQ